MSNPVSHFVDQLNEWGFHHPLPSQWAVEIPLPSGVSSSLDGQLRQLENSQWGIASALTNLTKPSVLSQPDIFCFFVDGVNLAGESYVMQSANIGDGSINGGLIPGLFSGGRQDFASRSVSITFRETAHSFADFVVRPWIILASHLGRIADQSNQIKTNVTVYSYGKAKSNNGPPVIRKIYRYLGCVPAKVESQVLKYSDDSSIMTYSTEWYFDSYSLNTAE